MKPSARAARAIERSGDAAKLADVQVILEHMIIEAENEILTLAAIEIENNYYPRFTQYDAALAVRKLKHAI